MLDYFSIFGIINHLEIDPPCRLGCIVRVKSDSIGLFSVLSQSTTALLVYYAASDDPLPLFF